MPPKPQVFKTPDGKEFNTRAEWRDYMMLTFYTFKDKKDEPAPVVAANANLKNKYKVIFESQEEENDWIQTLKVMNSLKVGI